jgi:hypothetical protein
VHPSPEGLADPPGAAPGTSDHPRRGRSVVPVEGSLLDGDDADPVGAIGFAPDVIARAGDPVALKMPARQLDAAHRVTLLNRSTGPAAGNLPLLPTSSSEIGHDRSSFLSELCSPPHLSDGGAPAGFVVVQRRRGSNPQPTRGESAATLPFRPLRLMDRVPRAGFEPAVSRLRTGRPSTRPTGPAVETAVRARFEGLG